MAEIYIKCEQCEAELPLREKDFEIDEETNDLRIYRQCLFCGFGNKEIVYLG